MQRLEVSGAVRLIYESLGVKRLTLVCGNVSMQMHVWKQSVVLQYRIQFCLALLSFRVKVT